MSVTPTTLSDLISLRKALVDEGLIEPELKDEVLAEAIKDFLIWPHSPATERAAKALLPKKEENDDPKFDPEEPAIKPGSAKTSKTKTPRVGG